MAKSRHATSQQPETVHEHGLIHLNGSRYGEGGRALCHIEDEDEDLADNSGIWERMPIDGIFTSRHQPSRRR